MLFSYKLVSLSNEECVDVFHETTNTRLVVVRQQERAEPHVVKAHEQLIHPWRGVSAMGDERVVDVEDKRTASIVV